MPPSDPLRRASGRDRAPAGARASRSGSCTPGARGDAPESGAPAPGNSAPAATFHPREGVDRVARCSRCLRSFPQAELRAFEESRQARVVARCLTCAVRGVQEHELLDTSQANARVVELVAAALATPTWGETRAAREQRIRMRQAPSVRRLMRVLADVGGAA